MPESTTFPRNAMVTGCGCVIGFALALEVMVFLPDAPGVAVVAVILSAVLATWATPQLQ